MFEKAYEEYGRNAGLARLFSVSRAAVSQWLTQGGFPARRAIQIEILSKGKYPAVKIVDPREVAMSETLMED